MATLSTLWDSLRPYWDAFNDFLSIPTVQVFGPFLIAGLLLLLKSVRRWVANLWLRSWAFLRDRLLVPSVYPALGLATAKDVVELQQQLRTSPPDKKENIAGLASRTIERMTLKWTLGENISRYLGKVQPNDVGANTIDHLLHGPFCPKCNRNLLFNDWQPGAFSTRRMLRTKCAECSWSIPDYEEKRVTSIKADPVKRHVYENLDAEFRRTNQLADKE